MAWFSKITQDISSLPEFIEHYQTELNQAKYEVKIIKGERVEKMLATLPGVTEHRFNQLQEIEAVLDYMNGQLRKTRSIAFKKYLENYPRQLTSRDAERYSDAEQDVIDMETLVNEIALVRNQWLGIMKALESKNFMLGHIVRLRVAGMEDITI
ncbi:hypothetical protein EBS02_06740 [bacterium]|nr:hypothetical protein [bacterium]